jgi:hypothetical protein
MGKKASRSNYPYIRQSRFYTKICWKRLEGNNPARTYNNPKYMCMEQWCPKFIKKQNKTLLNLKE